MLPAGHALCQGGGDPAPPLHKPQIKVISFSLFSLVASGFSQPFAADVVFLLMAGAVALGLDMVSPMVMVLWGWPSWQRVSSGTTGVCIPESCIPCTRLAPRSGILLCLQHLSTSISLKARNLNNPNPETPSPHFSRQKGPRLLQHSVRQLPPGPIQQQYMGFLPFPSSSMVCICSLTATENHAVLLTARLHKSHLNGNADLQLDTSFHQSKGPKKTGCWSLHQPLGTAEPMGAGSCAPLQCLGARHHIQGLPSHPHTSPDQPPAPICTHSGCKRGFTLPGE